MLVLQLDSPGTLDEDAVALGDRLVVAADPGDRVGRDRAGEGERRGPPADVRVARYAAVAPLTQTGPLLAHRHAPPRRRARPTSTPRSTGGSTARGRTVDRSHENEAMPAADALAYGFAESASPTVLELLNELDGQEVPTAAGPVVAADADRDDRRRGPSRRGRLDPVHRAGTDRAAAARGRLALDGLLPARVRAGVPRVRAHPARVRVRRVRRGRAPRARRLRRSGRRRPTWLGLALVLAAVGLLVADVRLRRLGVLSAAGIVLFGVGSFLLYAGGGRPDPDLAVAPGRGDRGDDPVLRVRADRGGPVAGPDHRGAAGADRAGRGGARAASRPTGRST